MAIGQEVDTVNDLVGTNNGLACRRVDDRSIISDPDDDLWQPAGAAALIGEKGLFHRRVVFCSDLNCWAMARS